MQETLLMAVDLGTSFIKAGVYDTESRLMAEASEPVRDYRPAPGTFIQKGEEIYDSVLRCICKIGEALGEKMLRVEAVAFTGQMSGFMGVDKDWNDVTTWSCSLDSRYMPYAERQMKALSEKFLTIAGTNFPAMAPKYEWFKTEFPRESEKIAKYMMISGYVIGRMGELSIEDAVIDRTFLQWTGLADVNANAWSDEMCADIGMDKVRLPRIVNSNDVCGRLSPATARVTGLKAGIPLVSGAGDKPAGCLGAAVVDYGDCIFEASSYGAINFCVPEYRPDCEGHWVDASLSAIPGDYTVTHFIAGSGITLDWFVDSFVRKEGMTSKEAFAKIDAAVKNVAPGSEGVFALGLLGGSSMPLDGALRGLWMGFTWSHQPAHFYRALLESYTYDFALCLDSIERLYPDYPFDRVSIIGGGAHSAVWPQLCADAQGKTYQTLSRSDVALWGAAILAGNAIGVFPDLKKTAKQYVHAQKEFAPDPAMKPVYDRYKRLYADSMKETRAFFERLSRLR